MTNPVAIKVLLVSSVILGTLCAPADENSRSGSALTNTTSMYVPAPPISGVRWVPGLHYNVLFATEPRASTDNKVEILELSMYTTWAATPKFKSELRNWIERNSAMVHYVRSPSVAFGMPHAQIQARIFFALEELGRGDLHEALDVWVKDPARTQIYHSIWHPNEDRIYKSTAEFLKERGVNEKVFERAYTSASVNKRVLDAQKRTGTYNVNGTPTYVINRRFSTSPQRLAWPNSVEQKDLDRLLALIRYLASAEVDGKQM